MNDRNAPDIHDLLKTLSRGDFLRIGVDEVAYIRMLPTKGASDVFGVYAADGTRLSVMDSMDTALAAVRHNDLMPVTLH